MDINPAKLIELLDLEPHPEGGYFRESYRSEGSIAELGRSYSTAIYYLLEGKACSKLHRIASDEMWHFYLGDPLVVAEIDDRGAVRETVLGTDLKAGQSIQHMVPAKRWFGAYLPEGSEYALVGCTVAPGFDFADFEMGGREELLSQYPQAKSVIERLT
jgi:predicted cupin superfamily sugar epimerase